ncbi:MAG: tRNA (adenosine(37)-N6)-dimethylallyltransferase MiaA [Candidatus Microsaccharimonas sossegonensis]|uniref:tRNA dimethylallyltransferase n=1 Tax=Candidatus Microsaccharimonas sossegonensis TaxID=2506948 RepID=A0A4V1J7F2_9BACT|nr:MAG: tRNA (adenosine(37)-N6)-dimethylallyltransferase MiaA [Candidatus Microsaccharimonas sossegonensis]
MATRLDHHKKEVPLIVIVGPTASGKSKLAIELAEQYKGEIIAADSRTIYKDMDIGTAKPSKADQKRVPHWGLDLIAPNESFSAAVFKAYAVQKIAEIRARGHVPFLVGGTGLYVDSVVFDYQFGPVADPEKRAELEHMSLAALHNYCIQNNITLPENDKNKRYVIRAIEQKSISTKRSELPIDNCIIVGITTDREVLRQRIHIRCKQLFDDGVALEAKKLGEIYGWENEAMTGNVYRLARQYLNNEITESEFKVKNETADWQLAKRQLTWMKRNPFIHWLSLENVQNYIAKYLA